MASTSLIFCFLAESGRAPPSSFRFMGAAIFATADLLFALGGAMKGLASTGTPTGVKRGLRPSGCGRAGFVIDTVLLVVVKAGPSGGKVVLRVR